MGRKPKKKHETVVRTEVIRLRPNDFLNEDDVFNATSAENVIGAIVALLAEDYLRSIEHIYAYILYYYHLGKYDVLLEDKNATLTSIREIVVPKLIKKFPSRICFVDETIFESFVPLIKRNIMVETVDGKVYHILDGMRYGEEAAMRASEVVDKIVGFNAERIDDYRRALKLGLKAACRCISDEEPNMAECIRWYLFQRKMLEGEGMGEMCLKWITQACERSDVAKDIFQDIYVDRYDAFLPLFEKYPEYKFVDDGRRELFLTFDDCMEKAFGFVLPQQQSVFFNFHEEDAPKKARPHTTRRRKKNGERRTMQIQEDYANTVLQALSKASSKISKNVVYDENFKYGGYFVVNMFPQNVKGRRVAKSRGDFIAICFRHHDEWWILIDSFKQGRAAYLWHGESYTRGLNIFAMPRSHAKGQPNVTSANHRCGKDTFAVYQRLFSKLGIQKVLD